MNLTNDRTTKLLLAVIALLLAIQVLSPLLQPRLTARAESQFDHISVLANNWIRKGRPGILLLDRRNGNIWFMQTPRDQNEQFGDPDFVIRFPFEKLDQATPPR